MARRQKPKRLPQRTLDARRAGAALSRQRDTERLEALLRSGMPR